MSTYYDGLAAALAALAAGSREAEPWQLVERACTVAVRARVRAMGCPANTSVEDLRHELFGRVVDRACAGGFPVFELTVAADPSGEPVDVDRSAGCYLALMACSLIADTVERRPLVQDAGVDLDEMPGATDDELREEAVLQAGSLDFASIPTLGAERFDRLVGVLREHRRAQDRAPLAAAASSLRRVAFEGRSVEEVLVEDRLWPDDPVEQRRVRDARYKAHQRLRETLVDLVQEPEMSALIDPWDGELAARFFANWLLRCQVRANAASSSQEPTP